MRTCKNCGSEMNEGYKLKINNTLLLPSISIVKDGFSNNMKAAVCPDCGEVSLYIESVDKVK